MLKWVGARRAPPLLSLFLGAALALPAPAQEGVATLLARGDTAGAIARLRQALQTEPTRERWCALGMLLTRASTSRTRDHRLRFEAQNAFAKGLERNPDPRCLYEYALLKE